MSIQSRRGSFSVVPVSLAQSVCSPPEVKCSVFGRLKNGKEKSLYRISFAILIKVGYIYLSWKRVEPEGSDVDAMGRRDNKPGGGVCHMKRAGMLAVSLRGVNFGCWSHLGCSGQNAVIFSRKGLF